MVNTYIGLDGLQWYDSEIKDYISKQIEDSKKQIVITADSYLEFPTLGDAECIYIDKVNNRVYRWDNANLKYYVIGSDYSEIEIIDGTGK